MEIACGTMHACALTKESADATFPVLDESKFAKAPISQPIQKPEPVAEPKPQTPAQVNGDHIEVKSQESKKRTHDEFIHAHGENAEIESGVKKLKVEE